MKILVVNGGSSSFKCWFHELEEPLPAAAPRPLWQKQVAWHGEPLDQVLAPALEELWSGASRVARGPGEIEAIGHRIVHGGAYRATTRLAPEVRTNIARQAEFAPAHNRFELEAIQAVDSLLGPDVPQFAVFDTAFHATLEEAAYLYPVPYAWLGEGVRQFGCSSFTPRKSGRSRANATGRRRTSRRAGARLKFQASSRAVSAGAWWGLRPRERHAFHNSLNVGNSDRKMINSTTWSKCRRTNSTLPRW